MEKKLKTDLKFTFEEIGDIPEVNVLVDMFNDSDKSMKKKITITNIQKTRKNARDSSTRLF